MTIALPVGYRLERHALLDSTNRLGLVRAGEGAQEGLILLADAQSAGRGRQGRNWASPVGNLYMSLLWRPDCQPARRAELAFVAGVAMAVATAQALPQDGPRVTCKWPNDILAGGEKIAGILLESQGEALIVGIGMNIASHPPRDATRLPATSLAALGARLDRDDMVGLAVTQLAFWYDLWRAEGFAPVRAAWLERADGLGQAITVRLPDQTLEGRFDGLDVSGALILSLADGGRRLITAGDVYRLHS